MKLMLTILSIPLGLFAVMICVLVIWQASQGGAASTGAVWRDVLQTVATVGYFVSTFLILWFMRQTLVASNRANELHRKEMEARLRPMVYLDNSPVHAEKIRDKVATATFVFKNHGLTAARDVVAHVSVSQRRDATMSLTIEDVAEMCPPGGQLVRIRQFRQDIVQQRCVAHVAVAYTSMDAGEDGTTPDYYVLMGTVELTVVPSLWNGTGMANMEQTAVGWEERTQVIDLRKCVLEARLDWGKFSLSSKVKKK